ncbi:MAG: D-threonine aldolase [Solirubrobacteraceae bacterium]|jgi:D-serine deaminase-like pyridoxal phosphate-dependent protein|nr:D-threonine aldolase [Solirubrobacteraceae bacterium]
MTTATANAELQARYGDQIGRSRTDVSTPALLLDLDKAKRNIATMAAAFRELPADLRPHFKAHKSPQLARLQVEAGAIGVACATVWEAIVVAEAGIIDVLITSELAQPDKVRAAAELARSHRLSVAVDDLRNAEQLSRAAVEAGAELEVLIELDVGMGRCGVRSREQALPLAERIGELPGLKLRGLEAYEGHVMLEPDPDQRIADARRANRQAIDAFDFLAERGHPVEVISAGGTGTYHITGANPRIHEVQAGSYVLMDAMHRALVPGGFEVAMTVAGTVISRQANTVVLDCGRKTVGIDFVTPPLVSHPEGRVRYFAEEHCIVDFPGPRSLDLGDVAEVMGGYGPTTVNLHDVFHVVEDGVVTDIWPVTPRGPGRP